MGPERVRAELRRPAAARRAGGRPAGAPSPVRGERPALHRGVARLRGRVVAGGAARGARGPGGRRRGHDADRPLDHLHDLPRGPRAQQGARNLGRARRHRCHRGVADRRSARLRPRVAVDLLHQHPVRTGGGCTGAAAAEREPGRGDAEKLRPRRGADRHRRARPAGVRARRGAGHGLGLHADDPRARWLGRAARCLRADRVAPPLTAGAAARPALARARRCEHGAAPGRHARRRDAVRPHSTRSRCSAIRPSRSGSARWCSRLGRRAALWLPKARS